MSEAVPTGRGPIKFRCSSCNLLNNKTEEEAVILIKAFCINCGGELKRL